MGTEYVLAWLNSINQPSIGDDHSTRSEKRRKTSHDCSVSRLLTPAGSDTDLGGRDTYIMASPGKRKRPDGDTSIEDPFVTGEPMDETPKANQAQVWMESQELERRGQSSPSFASTSSSRVSSSISHRSSPTKQFRNADLRRIFRPESFTVGKDRLPISLRHLRQGLMDISGGRSILPAAIREELGDVELPSLAFYDADEEDQKPRIVAQWRYPPAELVEEILLCAALCLDEYDGESSWNHDVHGPILKWVFGLRRRRPLVDYRYCTSAQVIGKFKPKHAPSKMVDNCIIIRPDDDGPECDAIEALCDKRPGQTINHTDWGSFCKSPITISIGTKRHLENWDEAVLQIGTWHSSQWRSLLWDKEHPLPSIDFIPGIIIQGHSWRFVASTFVNNKAVLYHSVEIGDTETELGILKITLSLQYLVAWVEKVYWPAFKADILGLAMM